MRVARLEYVDGVFVGDFLAFDWVFGVFGLSCWIILHVIGGDGMCGWFLLVRWIYGVRVVRGWVVLQLDVANWLRRWLLLVG